MKMLMIFFLLICSLSVNAYNNPTCIFTMINPSATNSALGIVVGGANIWNQNPLDVWSNPAKLGYFDGFSLGYSHDSYLEDVFDDIYFDSSYLNLGWKGIGLMLPMINNQAKFGSSFGYGDQDAYDEDGNFLGTFNSWESSSGFALGVNLLKFYGEMSDNDKITQLQSYSDFSIGYNYNYVESELAPEGTGATEMGYLDNSASYTDGLGMIFRISPLNELNYSSFLFFKSDIVYSLYYRNISKTIMDYGDYDEPMPYATESAFSIRMAMGNDIFKGLIIYDIISIFGKDILSINYLYGKSRAMDSDNAFGNGYDVTFLDIFSYRKGYYEDKEGNIEGKTSGYGINLNYKDLIHLQYNYAEIPGGDLQDIQEKEDYMLNINLLELLRKVN
ncbi:MAG: hypothetical protein P9L97_13200 [Candidatus Tenebribacter davisii]|nr:hypothetical protein [Candidatus Tenebribacter davisii]